LDRKIEIPLPNEQARLDILKIHSANITKHGEIGAAGTSGRWRGTQRLTDGALRHRHLVGRGADYEAIVKLSEGFNGADLRNVCTEAGAQRRAQRGAERRL